MVRGVRKGETEERKEGRKQRREGGERREKGAREEGRMLSTILVLCRKCGFSPYSHRSEVQSQFQGPRFSGGTRPKSLPQRVCG